ncbi:MAG TPA: metal-binding protein, partial [Pirellulales bacterium]
MKLDLQYIGRSELQDVGGSRLLSFAPNLARERVAFDAALRHPLRFREAISALHDVVVSDLRYQPRDKSVYLAWKAAEAQRMRKVQADAYHAAKTKAIAERLADMPPSLPADFEKARSRYWGLRQTYANRLARENFSLWRLLMPCDPIVTVAEDVVFFECFSKDESSYGCLTVARDGGFGPGDLAVGTTNIDYSWNLYNSFQSLRSYRETRLKVDPEGFEVATEGRPDYREEKIDLPDGWLQGFFQLQSAM